MKVAVVAGWPVKAHDHGTPTAEVFDQTKGAWLRPLLEKGLDAGIEFMICKDYYRGWQSRHQQQSIVEPLTQPGVAQEVSES